MRILFALTLTVIVFMGGCSYTSANLVRAQGTDLDISVNPWTNTYTAKGKDVALTIFRQSGIVRIAKDGTVIQPAPMPDITEGPQTWSLDNPPIKRNVKEVKE